MGWLIFFVVIALGAVAWTMRVQLMAKVLGQSEDRVRRQLEQRKRR